MQEVCARLLVGQEPEDIVLAVPTRRDVVKEAVRQLQEPRLLRADGKPSVQVPQWEGPRPVIMKFVTDEDRMEVVHFLGPTSPEQFSEALRDALIQAGAEGYDDPEIVPRPDGRLIAVFLSWPPRNFPLAFNEHVTVTVRDVRDQHRTAETVHWIRQLKRQDREDDQFRPYLAFPLYTSKSSDRRETVAD